MTTVTGPVTGPPRAPARLTMTPGRRVTLLIGVPVALALIGLNALSLVADVGTASFPVSRTIPVDHGRLAASTDGGDFTVRQGPAGGPARLAGAVQYSLIRPDFAVNGTGISLHCRLFLGNCGLNATLTVPPRTALDLTSGGGNLSDSGAGSILHFTTSGGDVDGSGLLAPDVTVESGGGDVSLTFTRVPANIDIGSSGGDITIVLPRGATEYAISHSTAGGDYGASVPANKFAAHKITVRSGGGDVSIIEPP